MNKVFLLDAYALIYRSYYAFIKNPRINSKGLNTSAIIGFVNTLLEVLEKEHPTHLGVAFDPHGPTFRSEAFPDYKAQREATPEDIRKAVPIIKELSARIAKTNKDPKVQIIDEDKRVHMAHIDIHYGYSVNGVAAIHTDILKNTELNAFYKLYPDKFNNKTNGITFRRWLLSCNRPLAKLLDDTIGTGYRKDADKLEDLLKYKDDETVLTKIADIKKQKKAELIEFVKKNEGVELDPDSIFDIQVKRLHEYKRQQMNALYIIHKYLEIKGGKKPKRPITCIFGAKAAPAYVIAKDIIHLLLVLQEIVNNDPDVSPYLKVLMVTNYNVSYAEKLIPACDVSEQISLASKEASGTSNMKFMLNGAITLGTDDGANVEIHDLVGDDNIFIFGVDSDTVIKHYEKADYVSKDYYKKSPVIKEAVDFIVGPEALKVGHKENLERLYKELLNKDWFMTLLDLEDYIAKKDEIFEAYEDQAKWRRMMLVNIAKAGYFSSDRTIADYNKDKHFDMILSKSGDNILMPNPKFNITKDVINGLNKRYKGGVKE
jgi:starch phosphorylase